MADLPTGTVTLLFSDVEGSTRLLQQQGERYGSLLAEYRALLRTIFQQWGGHEVDTQGDSFFVVFPRAVDAVAAAVAAQRALAAHPWPEGVTFRTRMGLHTGEPRVSGTHYVGIDVHRAARLMAVGYGGQVLLSQATQVLVAHDLPSGVELRDLGEHHLKDLEHPERIFQLVIPDLPSDFSPLKTLDNRPNNLPLQPTSFVGREREVEAVRQRLRDPSVRLVTLSGPGGTGKTRLAIQVATELLDDFPDGVWFVDLAPISDPALVASSIAQTLGVKEAAGQSLLESLKAFLREKQLLLVLDNFEQVVAAATGVADLLKAAQRSKALVTSRIVLHLYGEQEYPVPPLDLPDLKQRLPFEALSQYAAVALFIQRALAVKPDFQVTNDNAPAVAEICARLDGLPLAIELAAARVKLFPPQTLLGRLDQRLKTLTGGARDLPARQQTLRGTIDWSYNLLDSEEQTLLARLGVFVGGCTLEAAEAAGNVDADRQIDVLDGLASLVDKSLLRQGAGVSSEPRFMMLETIREYALERLAASGEEDTLREAHAHFFRDLVEVGAAKQNSRERSVWLERLEREHDNLRTALAWSLENRHVQGARLLGETLFWLWYARGYLNEGRSWLERALAVARDVPAVLRAWTLLWAGMAGVLQGDFDQGPALLEKSLALFQDLGDKAGTAEALYFLGLGLRYQDRAGAIVRLEQALALYQASGDRLCIARTINKLGAIARDQGDYPRARALLEQSLGVARELGASEAISFSFHDLAEMAQLQGDDEQAMELYRQSMVLWRQQENRNMVAWSLHNQGYLANHQDDDDRARACFSESLMLFQEWESMAGIGACLAGLARVANSHGQALRGAQLLGAVEAICGAIGGIFVPIYAAEYDRTEATTRAALDEQAFAAAWAEGRAMTLEQVIAYALEDVPDA